MARKTTTRTSARASAAPAAKRVGRPLGSKNKVPSKAKATPAATRRTASRKSAAPATPKMSKTDLEQHVVKLERSLARLRKQNAELKQAARDDAGKAPIPDAEPAAPPKAAAKPKRAAAPKKTRRQSAKAAETPPEPAEHEGDADMPADD